MEMKTNLIPGENVNRFAKFSIMKLNKAIEKNRNILDFWHPSTLANFLITLLSEIEIMKGLKRGGADFGDSEG